MGSRTEEQVSGLGLASNVQEYAYGVSHDSLIHSTSNHRLKSGRWSGGGGFFVSHYRSHHTIAELPVTTYFGFTSGGAAVAAATPASPVTPPSDPLWATEQALMTPHGVTGWARARPGNPVANLGQFVAELRDVGKLKPSFMKGSFRGIPGRALRALASFKALGSGYLSYEFGWKPFVNDLREMYNLTQTIDDRLQNLRRNNGRSVRRERVLKDSSEVMDIAQTDLNYPFAYFRPTPILGLTTGRSSRSVARYVRERIWFVGSFRYWVPDIGSLRWENKARRALWGANPTPSLLWEVLPWSWLSDWFTNTGDVLSNLSENAVENQVAQYAHVMRTYEDTTSEWVSTSWAPRETGPIQFGGGSAFSEYSVGQVTKSRVVANPYGFGITYDDLSVRQQGILAALAITRASFL